VTASEFDLESALVETLHSGCQNGIFGGAELITFQQVQVGSVIPDLVFVRQLANRRAEAKLIRLTLFESWIVGELLRAGRLRESTLTRRLFTRVDDIRPALKRLMRTGVLKETRVGTYSVQTDFSCRFEVLSVEAKLSRWRNAIEQAKRYLRFSDKSFVALPASIIARNSAIVRTCKEAGVGLIAVSAAGVDLQLTGVPNAPDRREWMWLLAKTGCLHV
jgi:hypothetical protein